MKKYPFLLCDWLVPNGDFTECRHEAHRHVARTKFNCGGTECLA